MTRLRYEVVDVFTPRPFAGNQLAVVFDAQDLATHQLQAIALEFNYSETVFVMPPTTDAATYRLRIFTPDQELPFAGHPSVGAAVVQLWNGMVKAGAVVQECGAGLLPLTITEPGSATLTGAAPSVGPAGDPAPVLAATGLTVDDLAGTPSEYAGCGLPWRYVQVRRDALARARVSAAEDVCIFAWDAAERAGYARVFVPGLGVAEDPATGSAALGLGVHLVSVGLLPGEGTSSYTIHQGYEMGRPSRLDCTVTAAGGVATSATVTGQVVATASGEIVVPPRD